jgi:ornithine carbamoyltransferase
MLADVLTMTEHSDKPIHQISFAFVGDGRNNVANSLLLVGSKLGMDVRIGAPRQLWPSAEHVEMCRGFAAQSGARITVTDDPLEAVAGVDFVHTDVWVSMGEPDDVWAERIELLLPYQVNAAALAATGNPDVKFMHCLPAFHDRHTKVGEELFQQTGMDALEVTDDVFESEHSIVFDQAENRMHTIKAVLVATLGA